MNVNSYSVMIFLIYSLGTGIEEFFEHLIKGLTLNNDIPQNELIYESNFIHYIRIIILSIVAIILIVISLICVAACGVAFYQSRI
jgi:flagellar biosynthesis protein FlhB